MSDVGAEALDCAAILKVYYEVYEPSFATSEKIGKILRSYQRKASKTGADWEELLFSDFVNQSGVDPRVFYQQQQRNPNADYMALDVSEKSEALDRLARAKQHAAVEDGEIVKERHLKKDRIADRAEFYSARRKMLHESQQLEQELVSQRYSDESAARQQLEVHRLERAATAGGTSGAQLGVSPPVVRLSEEDQLKLVEKLNQWK